MEKEDSVEYLRPAAKKAQESRNGIILAGILTVCLVVTTGYIALNDTSRTNTGPSFWVSYVQIPFGVKFTFWGNPDSQVNWGDLTVQLNGDSGVASWANVTTQDLTSSEKNTTWHYGSPKSVGSMLVWLNITDYASDGRINSGDTLTFTTNSDVQFSPSTTYVMALLYKPTASSLFARTFYVQPSVEA